MAYGDNWTQEDVPKEMKKKANKILEEVKKNRSLKKFKLVCTCKNPLTIVEVEIKDKK